MIRNLIIIVCFFSFLLSDDKDSDYSQFIEHPENGVVTTYDELGNKIETATVDAWLNWKFTNA